MTMRRLSSPLAAVLLAGGLTAGIGVNPARAQCPYGDGTLPGTSSSVIAIGEQTVDPNAHTALATIFVDDRELEITPFTDTGDLWLFAESGAAAGLQRGGDQVIFTVVNPNVPFFGPIVIVPSFPIVTLFPAGFGGGSLSQFAGQHDDCLEPSSDIVLF